MALANYKIIDCKSKHWFNNFIPGIILYLFRCCMHFLHLFQWCTKMWSWSRKMKDYEITFARLQHVTFWLLGQLMPNFFRRLNSGSCCRLPTKREKSGNYHYGFYRKDCKPLNTEIGSKSLCTPTELRTAIAIGSYKVVLSWDWNEIELKYFAAQLTLSLANFKAMFFLLLQLLLENHLKF